MSEFIPEVNWEAFKKVVEAGKVNELQSCEVIADGKRFIAIIGHGDMFSIDYARTQADYLGQKTNIVGGKLPNEIVTDEPIGMAVKYPNLAKAHAALKVKREKAKEAAHA